eukprot:COSAG01_NODE_524_length_15931_cov_72.340491_3_plen_284_part_00
MPAPHSSQPHACLQPTCVTMHGVAVIAARDSPAEVLKGGSGAQIRVLGWHNRPMLGFVVEHGWRLAATAVQRPSADRGGGGARASARAQPWRRDRVARERTGCACGGSHHVVRRRRRRRRGGGGCLGAGEPTLELCNVGATPGCHEAHGLAMGDASQRRCARPPPTADLMRHPPGCGGSSDWLADWLAARLRTDTAAKRGAFLDVLDAGPVDCWFRRRALSAAWSWHCTECPDYEWAGPIATSEVAVASVDASTRTFVGATSWVGAGFGAHARYCWLCSTRKL